MNNPKNNQGELLVGHSSLKSLIAACNLVPASRAKAADGLHEPSRKKRVYAQVGDAQVRTLEYNGIRARAPTRAHAQ
jgi:hypothetical protein